MKHSDILNPFLKFAHLQNFILKNLFERLLHTFGTNFLECLYKKSLNKLNIGVKTF